MKVHKEMITLMKETLQVEDEPEKKVEKQPQIAMSRKTQILDMVDSSAAQPNYQSNQRQTQTSLAKSRGGTSKSYVRVAGRI